MPRLNAAMRSFLADWKDDVATEWRALLDGVERSMAACDHSSLKAATSGSSTRR